MNGIMKLEKKLYKDQKIYIVICQFQTGTWGIADFWDKPYSSTDFQTVQEYKKDVIKRAGSVVDYWTPDKFAITKCGVV